MSDYLADVQLLEAELAQVEQAFRGLADSDWRRPTLLQPPGDTLPPWTIFELAGHLDIAVGVTRMLCGVGLAGSLRVLRLIVKRGTGRVTG
ncbi:MAG TPA: hypothetical protein VLW50_00495 [Streptosporangiaceae bacterium]|nr:hypothetical protein [Streptosporangiaceae bacterium]